METRENEKIGDETHIKAYKRRWFILAVYLYYSTISCLQYLEYSSINNIVVKYYNVSPQTVDWTSIVYMAIYPLLIIPASYIIDSKGLRAVCLIGCFGTLLATTVKVFSIKRDLFWVVLLGQVIVACAQVFILPLPTKVAAVWFKSSEVSTACSIGVLGGMIGGGIGYIMPPMIVEDSDDPSVIGHGFLILSTTLTAFMVPVCILVFFYFPKQPPLPPSKAQAEYRKKRETTSVNIYSNLKILFRNKAYVNHIFAYGLQIGVISGFQALLTQFILSYFKDENVFAGQVGFGLMLIGFIGSVSVGVFLDKTHTYKGTSIGSYFMSALSLGFFIYSLEIHSKTLALVSCLFIGYFCTAYNLAGIEMAIELTFPCDEGAATGILIAMTQMFGALLTVILGHMNAMLGPLWTLGMQIALLLVGTVIQCSVPNNLRRQDAFKRSKITDNDDKYHPVPLRELG